MQFWSDAEREEGKYVFTSDRRHAPCGWIRRPTTSADGGEEKSGKDGKDDGEVHFVISREGEGVDSEKASN